MYSLSDDGILHAFPATEPPNLSSLLFFVPNLQAQFPSWVGSLSVASPVLGILFPQIFLHHHAMPCLRLLFNVLPTLSNEARMSPDIRICTQSSGLGFQVGWFLFLDTGIPRSCSEVICSSLYSSGCCAGFSGSAPIRGGEAPLRFGLFKLSRPTSRAI